MVPFGMSGAEVFYPEALLCSVDGRLTPCVPPMLFPSIRQCPHFFRRRLILPLGNFFFSSFCLKDVLNHHPQNNHPTHQQSCQLQHRHSIPALRHSAQTARTSFERRGEGRECFILYTTIYIQPGVAGQQRKSARTLLSITS